MPVKVEGVPRELVEAAEDHIRTASQIADAINLLEKLGLKPTQKTIEAAIDCILDHLDAAKRFGNLPCVKGVEKPGKPSRKKAK